MFTRLAPKEEEDSQLFSQFLRAINSNTLRVRIKPPKRYLATALSCPRGHHESCTWGPRSRNLQGGRQLSQGWRSQPHQAQTACPMMSALSCSDSHGSSSVNIAT